MEEKRIEIKLRAENPLEAVVLEKIQTYDRMRYGSVKEYILHAVRSFEEPVEILPGTFLDQMHEVVREAVRKELYEHDKLEFM